MVLATLLISCMHASIRHVSDGVHPFEIVFFRNVFALIPVLPWAFKYGPSMFRTRRWGLLCLRAVVNVVAMLSFFYALSIAPLTQVTALGFLAPVFATVLAIAVFREAVGGRRWAAILLGFAGTIVILRPGFAAVGQGALLTIIAAFLWAGVLIIIKALARTESSATITVYMSLLMAPLALVPALFVWQWPTAEQLAWLVFIGILGGSGQMLMAQALKEAATNVVMPFDFLRLVWVTIIAHSAFAEVPDLFTWLGAVMIFAGGTYIAYRERRRQKNLKAEGKRNP